MNFIFEGGQIVQDISLGVFLYLIIILGVALFMGPSPELKTVVGSNHRRIQFICIINSIIIIIGVCSQL